jgi:hypothetical protein
LEGLLENSADTEEPIENPNPENPDDDTTDNDNGNELPAGSVTLADNLILDKDHRFVNYILPQTEYQKFLEDQADFKAVTKAIYTHLDDVYDFVFILAVAQDQPESLGYYGINHTVQNPTQGLGGNVYDNTAAYGSKGRLKSVLFMPRTEYIKSGPFLHEIAHYWANHGFIESTVGGHWGYASTGGQLGGFDELVTLENGSYQGKMEGQNGFGTFANGGNSVPYSNVELYMMGLIGPDELEPIQVAQNPKPASQFGQFTADGFTTLTAQDLIAEHGPRIPDHTQAQKEFTALAIIVSPEALSTEKLEQVNTDLENFARPAQVDSSWGNTYNFWMATAQKATLKVDVHQLLE